MISLVSTAKRQRNDALAKYMARRCQELLGTDPKRGDQARLAKRLGIDPPQLTVILQGGNGSLEMATKIARTLNEPLDQFLAAGGVEPRVSASSGERPVNPRWPWAETAAAKLIARGWDPGAVHSVVGSLVFKEGPHGVSELEFFLAAEELVRAATAEAKGKRTGIRRVKDDDDL